MLQYFIIIILHPPHSCHTAMCN